MPALPDRFGVGAGQHFDDVVEAEREAAFLLHAQNAGEKFLRRHRAVEGLARVEAVVAAVARFVRPNFSQSSAAEWCGGIRAPRRNAPSGATVRARSALRSSLFSSMKRVCLTTSLALKRRTHSLGSPSRPARPVSW